MYLLQSRLYSNALPTLWTRWYWHGTTGQTSGQWDIEKTIACRGIRGNYDVIPVNTMATSSVENRLKKQLASRPTRHKLYHITKKNIKY